MEFKQWFLINESKQQKELALELAGDTNILNQLNSEIPQGKKNTDSISLLAAYFYSKTKNINQIKIDIKDYIDHLDKNKMQLYDVDLKTKQPPIDYIAWTQIIHAHQAQEINKQTRKYQTTEQDFQNEIPIKSSPDGKIKVYRANSAQQCIILGKGQSFCISQPGNPMFQSYRDNQVSTFYFVYDNTRNDDLRIVVVDVNENGIELTDCKNETNMSIQDPYSNEEKRIEADSELYFQYLIDKGIDTNIFKNIKRTPEEKAEQEKLGTNNRNFDWFKSLSFDEKSKYIGRGHLLSDEQFDHLFDNKLMLLLEQYVKNGLQLTDHQIDKIASKKDLKSNYIHNRIIALQHSFNINNKEWDLLSDKQKKEIYEYPNANIEDLAKLGDLNFDRLEYLVDVKKKPITTGTMVWAAQSGDLKVIQYLSDNDINRALKSGNLKHLKYLIDVKEQKIPDDIVKDIAHLGNLELVKYLVDEKKQPISNNYFTNYTVENAARSGSLELVQYLIDVKKQKIPKNIIEKAAFSGNLKLVQYLINKKFVGVGMYAILNALNSGSLELVQYLNKTQYQQIPDNAVMRAVGSGNLELVKYLINIEKLKIDPTVVTYAAKSGSLELVKYLVDEKEQKIPEGAYENAVENAAESGNLEIVKYLVDEKEKEIPYNTLRRAIISGNLEIVKYLIEVKGKEIPIDAVENAARSGSLELIKYLINKKND